MADAVEFIKENFPITATQLNDQKCFGIGDIGYLCEKYHQHKLMIMASSSNVVGRSELSACQCSGVSVKVN